MRRPSTLDTLAALAAVLGAVGGPLAAQDAPAKPAAPFEVFYGSNPPDYRIALTGPTTVESPSYAFRVAKILPVTSPPIDDGIVLTKNSKIVAFGPAATTAVPEGYELVDFGDREVWVCPGFVDLHCHIAAKSSRDINDTVHQTNAEMRTYDLVTMDHEAMRNALAGGVTTVLYIPGSGSNMGGFGTLTKTAGRTPEEALIRFPGCLKIAQAGNPERRAGDLGMTRMGMNEGLRATLTRGRDYQEAWAAWEAGTGEKPEFRPDLHYLRGLFRHEYPVCVHTQIYQVVMMTIRELRHEFGLWTVIVHGTFDGYRLSQFARESGVPVCNGPRQYHFETGRFGSSGMSRFTGLAAAWHAGGQHGWREPVLGLGDNGIGVNTDSPVVAQEQLQLQCAMAVRLGLPTEIGLRAITINQAHFVKVQDRVGSIEVGKDADLAFWTGDPLDLRNRVEMTVVNGNIAYRRSSARPRF